MSRQSGIDSNIPKKTVAEIQKKPGAMPSAGEKSEFSIVNDTFLLTSVSDIALVHERGSSPDSEFTEETGEEIHARHAAKGKARAEPVIPLPRITQEEPAISPHNEEEVPAWKEEVRGWMAEMKKQAEEKARAKAEAAANPQSKQNANKERWPADLSEDYFKVVFQQDAAFIGCKALIRKAQRIATGELTPPLLSPQRKQPSPAHPERAAPSPCLAHFDGEPASQTNGSTPSRASVNGATKIRAQEILCRMDAMADEEVGIQHEIKDVKAVIDRATKKPKDLESKLSGSRKSRIVLKRSYFELLKYDARLDDGSRSWKEPEYRETDGEYPDTNEMKGEASSTMGSLFARISDDASNRVADEADGAEANEVAWSD